MSITSISSNGLTLIKNFEGCKLTAYKDSAGVTTIGYGHTGSDIKMGMTITQAQADAYLKADIAKFEKKVAEYNSKYNWNQNQFDAMVSFCMNIGNINGLTKNGTRTIAQISSKITSYTKAGGKVQAGLVKRRATEKTLFDTAVGSTSSTSASSTASAASTTSASSSTSATTKAKGYNKSLAGTYTTTSALYLRSKPGVIDASTVLQKMPKGASMKNYGYYTDVNGVRWLYVSYNGTVGFASSKYLKK